MNHNGTHKCSPIRVGNGCKCSKFYILHLVRENQATDRMTAELPSQLFLSPSRLDRRLFNNVESAAVIIPR
jgi:hypothetical protein